MNDFFYTFNGGVVLGLMIVGPIVLVWWIVEKIKTRRKRIETQKKLAEHLELLRRRRDRT